MSGINLSQTIQEKQAQAQMRFFDQGLVVSFGLVIFLLGVWGGLWWYAGSLTQKVQSLDTTIQQKMASLKGKEVDRLVDFTHRLQMITTHLAGEPDPMDLARLLEGKTMPSVRLTGVEYVRNSNKLLIAGEARSLKEIAQQMLVFKQVDTVKGVTVDEIRYANAGLIEFVITVQ